MWWDGAIGRRGNSLHRNAYSPSVLRPGTSTASRGDQNPTANKPHWWAVLAVLLALMALVASVSSTTHHPAGSTAPTGGRAHSAARSGTAHERSGSAITLAPPLPSTTTLPGVPTTTDPSSPETPDTVVANPAGGSATTQPTGDDPATGATAASTTTTVATGTTVTTTTTTTGATTTHSNPGNLDYPDNTSAIYHVATDAAVTATATWSGAPTLSLSISCPDRQAQQSGPTGLSVSVPAQTPAGGGDTCSVTIAEPTTSEATVSYSLAVQYAGN